MNKKNTKKFDRVFFSGVDGYASLCLNKLNGIHHENCHVERNLQILFDTITISDRKLNEKKK